MQRLALDPYFVIALVGGIGVAIGFGLLNSGTGLSQFSGPWVVLQFVLLFPLLEELVFRGWIHGTLYRYLSAAIGPISGANALTGILFVLAHLVQHPGYAALLVFIPSLIFGFFFERYRCRLLPSILLHIVYNSAYLSGLILW